MSEIKLFWVDTRADNLHGYKDVRLRFFVTKRPQPLFGSGGSLGIAYRDLIVGWDERAENFYSEMALEERFTEAEANALVEWLKAHRDDNAAIIEPMPLPIGNNIAGVGSIAVGGRDDFLMVSDADDYDLPFKAWAYYDLTDCEFDETLPGARRKAPLDLRLIRP